MADLTTYPLEDAFETTLASSWNGGTGTVSLNAAPDFTFPAGVTTYIVVNAGRSNAQIAEINAIDTVAKTVTVSNISGLELGAGISSTQQTHAAQSQVLISDNYQFFKDIATAINSKADDDLSNLDQTGDITINAGGGDLILQDASTPATTLSTLAAASGADQKVAITVSDTTTSVLDDKLTAGDGLSKTVTNPGGAETLDLDVDTSDTTTFVKTSSGAGDENKVPVLNASGQLASGFVSGIPSKASDADAIAKTNTTDYTTPSQFDLMLNEGDYDDVFDIHLGYGIQNTDGTTPTESFRNSHDRITASANVTYRICDFMGTTGSNTSLDRSDIDVMEWTFDAVCDNAASNGEWVVGFDANFANAWDNYSGNTNFRGTMVVFANDQIRLWSQNSSSGTYGATVSGSTNEQNFKIVYDVGTDMKLYIDGVLQDTKTDELPTTTTDIVFGLGFDDTTGTSEGVFKNMKVKFKYV